MVTSNGALASALLTVIPGTSLRLRPGAAVGFVNARAVVQARYGWTPTLTDGYRTYAEQVAIFTTRYTTTGPTAVDRVGKSWQGQRWYRKPGYAAAATPGTSNHGLGLAIDVSGLGPSGSTRWSQWAAVARPLGWSNAEGASIGEPWHWVWTGAETVSNPTSSTGSVTGAPDLTDPAPVRESVKTLARRRTMWTIRHVRTGKTYSLSPGLLKHHANPRQRELAEVFTGAAIDLNTDEDVKNVLWDFAVPMGGKDPIEALASLPVGGQIGPA